MSVLVTGATEANAGVSGLKSQVQEVSDERSLHVVRSCVRF